MSLYSCSQIRASWVPSDREMISRKTPSFPLVTETVYICIGGMLSEVISDVKW